MTRHSALLQEMAAKVLFVNFHNVMYLLKFRNCKILVGDDMKNYLPFTLVNLLQETAARSKHDQLVTLAQQSEKAKQDAEATALRNTEGLKQGHRVSGGQQGRTERSILARL